MSKIDSTKSMFYKFLQYLSKKMKSINRKGAQALRNSPVGYFSAVARLQGWILRKGRKRAKR